MFWQSSSDENGFDEEEEEEDSIYEVEAILDHRTRYGKIQYLMKWKGYDDEDENTWEYETNLNCPDILSEYKAKQKKNGIDLGNLTRTDLLKMRNDEKKRKERTKKVLKNEGKRKKKKIKEESSENEVYFPKNDEYQREIESKKVDKIKIVKSKLEETIEKTNLKVISPDIPSKNPLLGIDGWKIIDNTLYFHCVCEETRGDYYESDIVWNTYPETMFGYLEDILCGRLKGSCNDSS
ncbi:hypothetical protein TRFO_02272 [Tritrichomonas foetus]|uniref:Chromo domain-containing protein n=1 Tax=Tritrichomonas foetus TaxID=1144522 RepID=A0A1J4J7T8_9EUKA|nr:hypothetical protein TRFO_02272 [Tritrichomonas foetus]|eukprot:OHS95270.1 hypothetical protein TRFO_02272 [Tritrichomonas foetus]